MENTKKKWSNLFLLCGPSGAGKTTWADKMMNSFNTSSNNNITAIHISRDAIRFQVLEDNEDYFAHEDQVFDLFCKSIQTAIDNNISYIFVDATHLNEKSRNKVLDKLNLDNTNLFAVNFIRSLDTCLSQNKLREGRARVPESVVRRMYYSFIPANENEKYKYKHILVNKEI